MDHSDTIMLIIFFFSFLFLQWSVSQFSEQSNTRQSILQLYAPSDWVFLEQNQVLKWFRVRVSSFFFVLL